MSRCRRISGPNLSLCLTPIGKRRLIQAGLMIESPMLLLREGHRDIHITFGLEEDSISYFKELIAITEQSSHETGRVLNDAFR